MSIHARLYVVSFMLHIVGIVYLNASTKGNAEGTEMLLAASLCAMVSEVANAVRARGFVEDSILRIEHRNQPKKHIRATLAMARTVVRAREAVTTRRDMTKTTINTIYISFACFYMNHCCPAFVFI